MDGYKCETTEENALANLKAIATNPAGQLMKMHLQI